MDMEEIVALSVKHNVYYQNRKYTKKGVQLLYSIRR